MCVARPPQKGGLAWITTLRRTPVGRPPHATVQHPQTRQLDIHLPASRLSSSFPCALLVADTSVCLFAPRLRNARIDIAQRIGISAMFPFLEVSHLPSSSSFYSDIIQPLGIRYLSTEDGHFPSIIYGDELGGVPLFQLRQTIASRDRPLKRSHLVLSAPSAEAAEHTYDRAVRANPDSRDSRLRYRRTAYEAASGASATRTLSGGGKIRVNVTDFDGNTMEIVYRPPSDHPDYRGGATYRPTQSTRKEATRILDWNYDVVSADVPPPGSRTGGSSRTVARRPYDGHLDDEPYSSLRRSVTETPTVFETLSPRQHSNGLSTGTVVVGALLAGAAIGSAFTYGRAKADRSRAPRQEFDEPPAFSRRSTFPDPYPDRYSRYVDVEREIEKVRRREDYAPVADYRPAPEYVARYSQVGSSRSRAVDDIYEEKRSRYDAPRSRASSGRARSESATNRQPLLLAEPEHRSHVSSRSSRHPPIVQRSYTYETPERDSYVSARSHHSSNTIRGPPPPGVPHQIVSRSRSGSRTATTTIKVMGNSGSRTGTYISARGIPLPPSGVGSSRAEWDDDAESVAPSDSISNVGSRRSGRSYR